MGGHVSTPGGLSPLFWQDFFSLQVERMTCRIIYSFFAGIDYVNRVDISFVSSSVQYESGPLSDNVECDTQKKTCDKVSGYWKKKTPMAPSFYFCTTRKLYLCKVIGVSADMEIVNRTAVMTWTAFRR